MPAWSEIFAEITATHTADPSTPAPEAVRSKYLKKLYEHTGRNVILYYSGWLYTQVQNRALEVEDGDMTGFMTVVYGLDRAKGLDLVLHTPGGNIAAAEHIGNYLRSVFGTNMRALVPHLAMSAGTMLACACTSIVMGRQSSLGPIDPQFGGISADGVIEEFERAVKECRDEPTRLPLWQVIISKYHPTFLDQCTKAQAWSRELVSKWLASGMFLGLQDPHGQAERTVQTMASNRLHLSHSRHLAIQDCQAAGLVVTPLEDDQMLQELLLSVHHAACIQLQVQKEAKLIENHVGRSYGIGLP